MYCEPDQRPLRLSFLGLPPSLPLALDAACLAALLDLPPACPSLDAIQVRDPRKPCKIAGRYRSASSFGKWIPKPDGLISISCNREGVAFSRPWASRGEKLTFRFDLR